MKKFLKPRVEIILSITFAWETMIKRIEMNDIPRILAKYKKIMNLEIRTKEKMEIRSRDANSISVDWGELSLEIIIKETVYLKIPMQSISHFAFHGVNHDGKSDLWSSSIVNKEISIVESQNNQKIIEVANNLKKL